MKCSCGGTIIITNKPRDGERAHCARCQACISFASLLRRINEYKECATDRTVYSQETKDAHGAVLEAGMKSDEKAFFTALRQLATMVHCDITGELREPHTLMPLQRIP